MVADSESWDEEGIAREGAGDTGVGAASDFVSIVGATTAAAAAAAAVGRGGVEKSGGAEEAVEATLGDVTWASLVFGSRSWMRARVSPLQLAGCYMAKRPGSPGQGRDMAWRMALYRVGQ